MKTKLTLTWMAVAAIATFPARGEEVLIDADGDGFAETVLDLNTASGAPVSAPVVVTDGRPICGGADDDQLAANSGGTSLCGGADDDQIVGGDGSDFVKPPVPQGLATDALGLIGSAIPQAAGSTAGSIPLPPVNQGIVLGSLDAVSGITGGGPGGGPGLVSDTLGMTSGGGGWTLLAGSAPVLKGIESDPFGICGGNGNDSFQPAPGITGDAGDDEITGDAGDDLTDRQILELLSTGQFTRGTMHDDDLWGGGGTDEIVVVNPSQGSI